VGFLGFCCVFFRSVFFFFFFSSLGSKKTPIPNRGAQNTPNYQHARLPQLRLYGFTRRSELWRARTGLPNSVTPCSRICQVVRQPLVFQPGRSYLYSGENPIAGPQLLEKTRLRADCVVRRLYRPFSPIPLV